MTGVVIRCSHCGTTQASLGECEACHEGVARYFCPNHVPGQWLDSPACAACGARLGVAPPGAPAPLPPRSGRAAAATTPPPPPATRPPRRTDALPRYESAPPRRPRDPDDHDALTGEVRGEGSGASSRSGSALLDMLVRAAGAAASSRAAARVPRHPAATRGTGSSLFGCLRRLAVLAVVLIILAIFAFVMLFGQGGILHRATMSGARSVPSDGSLAACAGEHSPRFMACRRAGGAQDLPG